MKSIREQLTDLAEKHGLDEKGILGAYASRLEQGMTPVDAYQDVYEETKKQLGSLDEFVPPAKMPSTGKEIMLPVEETKFEEFDVGVHPVRIVDALLDESETGETDKGGRPIMRKYLRLVFEDGKGTHMTGFASAKISTRSKLFDWIK
ncbi:MAG: hypothetical protein HWN51_00760, partial [Desulfobacterales bacterium]|nr:hypothetical protein [Desulfobacterales bacterium]